MATNFQLTRRQQEILQFLLDQQDRSEYPPSLNALCRALGLRSRGSLHKHIRGLVEAGLVEPMQGKHRGIRLTEQAARESRGLPLLGYIAAGQPIEAIETPEAVEIPSVIRIKSECYVLQVKGHSMVEEGILDGDWVIIEKRDYARNGEIVVALIDGIEATLKRIEQKRGRVILHPANGSMKPMVYPPDQVQIQGVLVGLMRAY